MEMMCIVIELIGPFRSNVVKHMTKKLSKTFTRGLSYSLGVSCGLFNSVLWCSAVFYGVLRFSGIPRTQWWHAHHARESLKSPQGALLHGLYSFNQQF